MAWIKAGTNTLNTAQSNNVITGLSANTFNQFFGHVISGVGNNQAEMQFGNGSIDGGTNYAFKKSNNYGTPVPSTSTSVFKLHNSSSQQDKFFVGYIVNIATEEKIGFGHIVENGTEGNNAPNVAESVGKWDNTLVQFDQIEHQSSNLQSDTNLTVLGSDGVESLGVQDGAIYYETDTNKEYVLYNNTWTEV